MRYGTRRRDKDSGEIRDRAISLATQVSVGSRRRSICEIREAIIEAGYESLLPPLDEYAVLSVITDKTA